MTIEQLAKAIIGSLDPDELDHWAFQLALDEEEKLIFENDDWKKDKTKLCVDGTIDLEKLKRLLECPTLP